MENPRDPKLISRRAMLLLTGRTAGATALGAFLAACGAAAPTVPEAAAPTTAPESAAPTEAAAAPPPTTAPAAPEQVTVEFLGWPALPEFLDAEMEKFADEHPEIKIQHVEQQEGVQMLTLLAAGTPPDASRIESNVYRTFARDGVLLDITGRIDIDPVLGAKDYFLQPQESDRCVYEGKWYGIGSCWVAPHLYYNADLFKEEGIDPPSNDPDEAWDWNTFVDVARKLTKDKEGKHPGDSGFDPDNVDRYGVDWPTWWIPLHAAVQSNEAAWIDAESGKVVLDSPNATQALQNIADLALVHHVRPLGTFAESLGMTVVQMLENGKLAMAVDGSWSLATLYKLQIGLGTAVLPKMKRPATDLQAHLHCVVKDAKQPDAAWETVRFLSTEWYQERYCKEGLWLPSQTALLTPDAIARWCTAPVHPAGFEKLVTEYVPGYGHFLTMPVGYAKAEAILTPALDSIWTGDATAVEAMAVVPEANDALAAEAAR